MEKKFVCASDEISCTFGKKSSELKITDKRPLIKVGIRWKKIANSKDFLPGVNIFPFKECNSPQKIMTFLAIFAPLIPVIGFNNVMKLAKTCIPSILKPWNNTSKDVFCGMKALTDKSQLTCFWQGTIGVRTIKQEKCLSEGNNGNQNKVIDIFDYKEKFNFVKKSVPQEPEIKIEKVKINKKNYNIDSHEEEQIGGNNEKMKDKRCPFCNKLYEEGNHNKATVINTDYDKKSIKSIPELLNCPAIGGEAEGKYTKANHHIIPVNECYLKFRELKIFTLAAGYDINNPNNGIGLPTVYNKYKGLTETVEMMEKNLLHPEKFKLGDNVNFGNLKKETRREIAFKVMEETGMQWHVGNHDYIIDGERGSPMNYSKAVLKELNKLYNALLMMNVCERETNLSEEIIKKVDKTSEKIKMKIEKFKENPELSSPFFVSVFAKEFSENRTKKR